MENERSPRRSRRRRRSPIISPSEPNTERIKIPKEGDNDAMLLWRATVSPINNIGEPYLAEWMSDFPPDHRHISEIDNSQPQRWMRMSYHRPNAQVYGWWFPGHLVEDIYMQNNFGVEDLPFGYVAHTPLLARHAPLYQQAPPLPHVIPLGILDEEYVEMLADQTFNRGKKYIRNYVDRYIKTIHPFDARYTPEFDKRLRANIVKLLIEASLQNWNDAPVYACRKWDQNIRPVVDNNMLGLDLDLFDDDMASEALYNKKGKPAIPGNKANAAQFCQFMFRHDTNFEKAQDAHFPHLKPVKEGRRRKSQRSRYQKELRREGRDPSAIYNGGRHSRTRKHTHS